MCRCCGGKRPVVVVESCCIVEVECMFHGSSGVAEESDGWWELHEVFPISEKRTNRHATSLQPLSITLSSLFNKVNIF